ncbi:MAG: SH3 domain-containing protein [Deltaproteobacteria bacterium]|nr:SH3 domain-containing protein [Deltaproteobacteria bacterium]
MAAACLNASLGIISLALLFTLIPSSSQVSTETTDRRARVAGASYVNLRSGPGISHPPVTILKNGEEVTVEKLEGSWYRISLADGLRGYVYAELIHFLPEQAEQEQEQTAAPATPPTPTIEVSLDVSTPQPQPDTVRPEPVVEQPEEDLPTPIEAQVEVPGEKTPANPPEFESSPPKTQAVVPRKIETSVPVNASQGRVWEVIRWILVPGCIFTLGWILGGNYYLRWDRIERTKLRF